MAQGRLERFQEIRRDASRFFARKLGQQTEVLDIDTIKARGINFYNLTYKLLEETGAFENGYLSSWEEKAFFTERVGANFLRGIFPQVNERAINGKRNKIDYGLLAYLREKLPPSYTPLPESTAEEIAVENPLDKIARDVYMILHVDAVNRFAENQIVNDFIGALNGNELVLAYYPGSVVSKVQNCLEKYKNMDKYYW